FLAEPVVTDDPDALAVPRLFVPGGGGSEATVPELLGPPGFMAELLMPPALPVSEGVPVTPGVPVPAEPGFGEAVALAGLDGAVVTPALPAPVEPPLGEPADVPPVPPPALPPPAPLPPV
ncbi:MAG: hypothetical protein ACJ8E2_13035, partial [Bradyrhizobium sp.]